MLRTKNRLLFGKKLFKKAVSEFYLYFIQFTLNLLEAFMELFVQTWLLVKTLKTWSSESGANPKHSFADAITPATNVPCPSSSSKDFSLVQSVRSAILLKWGWVFDNPVSNTATFTPDPENRVDSKTYKQFIQYCSP